MVFLASNFPFAQGVFTAIIIGIVLFIFKTLNKGVDKTIGKAYLSSNNVNKLLNYANQFFIKGQVNEMLEAYKKVLTLEPFNSTALVTLGYTNFKQEKFDEAEIFYEQAYQYYFLDNPLDKNRLEEKPLAQLHLAMYQYGFIMNKQGLENKSIDLKKLSMENKYFVDNYKNIRSVLAY